MVELPTCSKFELFDRFGRFDDRFWREVSNFWEVRSSTILDFGTDWVAKTSMINCTWEYDNKKYETVKCVQFFYIVLKINYLLITLS